MKIQIKSEVNSTEFSDSKSLGKDDLHKAIKEVYEENPKAFEVLDILLAVRTKGKKKVLNSKGEFVSLESYFTSVK